jgi:MoxR-like ATPase
MPADIVGVNMFQSHTGGFQFSPGPIFCDLLLADEINRAPAKTQSALLEAMQEQQVSVDGQEHRLSDAFTTFATQNPVEYEGTYPLPEAQLDRFLFKTVVGYPEKQQEVEILNRYQAGFDAARTATFGIQPCTSVAELAELRAAVRRVRVEQPVLEYITSIIRGTRGLPWLMLGASPRASVMLLLAGKGLAVLQGRSYVVPDDVRDLAAPVLRHRIVLNPEAEIEGMTADQCVARVLERIEVPRL